VRIGVTYERKEDYPYRPEDPADANSELLSAQEEEELLNGLRDAGHEVIPIGDARRLLERLSYWQNECDLVLNKSVGYRGPERKSIVPTILEAANIPYIGSTPYTLSLTRNKYHTKLIVKDANVPTPPAALLFGGVDADLDSLIYPVIVKPIAESSSIGIETGVSVVDTPEQAYERAAYLYERYAQPILVETFIAGTEIEVPLITDPDPKVLGVLAVSIDGKIPDDEYYLSSDTVYNDNYNFVETPEHVDNELVAAIAARAAKALGIRDYGRIDFRVSRDGTPWMIEASTHPHIQRLSSFCILTERAGGKYHDMLDMLVQVAARRYQIAYYV
jgi:D-alanine-D-alanine ligase